jgi:hypothetical protein
VSARHPAFSVSHLVLAEDAPWSPIERLVALAVSSFMGTQGTCYPSIARLVECTGLGRRTVQRAVDRLTGPGGIFVETPGGSDAAAGRRASVYTLATGVALTPVKRQRGGRRGRRTGATVTPVPASGRHRCQGGTGVTGARDRRHTGTRPVSETTAHKRTEVPIEVPIEEPRGPIPPAAGPDDPALRVIVPEVVTPRLEGSWLTPYGDAWKARWGAASEPPYAEMARPMKTAEERLGRDEAIRRWTFYLATERDVRFTKPATFLKGLDQWVAGGAAGGQLSPAAATAANFVRLMGREGQR